MKVAQLQDCDICRNHTWTETFDCCSIRFNFRFKQLFHSRKNLDLEPCIFSQHWVCYVDWCFMVPVVHPTHSLASDGRLSTITVSAIHLFPSSTYFLHLNLILLCYARFTCGQTSQCDEWRSIHTLRRLVFVPFQKLLKVPKKSPVKHEAEASAF